MEAVHPHSSKRRQETRHLPFQVNTLSAQWYQHVGHSNAISALPKVLDQEAENIPDQLVPTPNSEPYLLMHFVLMPRTVSLFPTLLPLVQASILREHLSVRVLCTKTKTSYHKRRAVTKASMHSCRDVSTFQSGHQRPHESGKRKYLFCPQTQGYIL